MTPNPNPNAAQMREAFYALSTAKRIPDAELLDEVVRLYPGFADELTDFAIELALDALRGVGEAVETAVDPGRMSPAVSRAMSRFHNRRHALRAGKVSREEAPRDAVLVENPFARLDRTRFRDLAARIGGNTVLVSKLRDRQIEPATIPEGFSRLVADGLAVPVGAILAHFAAEAGGGPQGQFYKSDGKPGQWRRQGFEDAVRGSGLTEEQQRRLLGL